MVEAVRLRSKAVSFGDLALMSLPDEDSDILSLSFRCEVPSDVDGRAEALERGLLLGDGPSAGVGTSGQDVVIIGLPSKMTADELRAYLVENKLVEEGSDGKGDCEVLFAEP